MARVEAETRGKGSDVLTWLHSATRNLPCGDSFATSERPSEWQRCFRGRNYSPICKAESDGILVLRSGAQDWRTRLRSVPAGCAGCGRSGIVFTTNLRNCKCRSCLRSWKAELLWE